MRGTFWPDCSTRSGNGAWGEHPTGAWVGNADLSAGRFMRHAAARPPVCGPTCSWRSQLPVRNHRAISLPPPCKGEGQAEACMWGVGCVGAPHVAPLPGKTVVSSALIGGDGRSHGATTGRGDRRLRDAQSTSPSRTAYTAACTRLLRCSLSSTFARCFLIVFSLRHSRSPISWLV